jgi:hypothetical protein
MTFNEMAAAVADAEQALFVMRRYCGKMVQLLAGNLRASEASPHYLSKLKRELQDWNIHTSQWNPQ